MYPRVDENKVITVRCLHRLNLLIWELKLALPVRISWQHLRLFILFLYYGSCLYQLSQSLGLSSHYIPPSIIYQKYFGNLKIFWTKSGTNWKENIGRKESFVISVRKGERRVNVVLVSGPSFAPTVNRNNNAGTAIVNCYIWNNFPQENRMHFRQATGVLGF